MKTAKIYTLNISAWLDSKLNKTGKKYSSITQNLLNSNISYHE